MKDLAYRHWKLWPSASLWSPRTFPRCGRSVAHTPSIFLRTVKGNLLRPCCKCSPFPHRNDANTPQQDARTPTLSLGQGLRKQQHRCCKKHCTYDVARTVRGNPTLLLHAPQRQKQTFRVLPSIWDIGSKKQAEGKPNKSACPRLWCRSDIAAAHTDTTQKGIAKRAPRKVGLWWGQFEIMQKTKRVSEGIILSPTVVFLYGAEGRLELPPRCQD